MATNYQISSDTLTAIADAIRTGTGQSSKIRVSEIPFAASEIDTTGQGKVPSYWENAVNNTVTTIQMMASEDANNVPLFAYFSDCHINPSDTTPNPGHTGTLAAIVMNACQIPFAMCCGDSARSDGNGLTTEGEMVDCFIAANHNFAPIGWHRLLQTQGNHDGSWGTKNDKTYAYQMSADQLYNYIYRKQYTTSNHVFGGGDNSYFYVEDTEHKIRIIMLNSLWCEMSYNEDGTAAYDRQHYFGYGQAQLDWLATTALNVESDWVIFIGTHIPPLDMTVNGTEKEYRTKLTRDIEVLLGILSAYENKTSYSGSYNKNTSHGEGDWANVSVSVDFSNALGKIAGFFTGHCHVDKIITDELPFPVITITSDGNIPYDSAEETRVMGTDNEHAIDFVTINTAIQMVSLTRLGVGASRAYSYAGIVVYAITNNLVNVSTSNGAASIEAGSAYSATLHIADGYEWDSVTITMGGVDITASAYADGVITISEVTGDVIITASARVPPKYTNLADPSADGWVNDSRLSSSGSDKGEGGFAGGVVTNWISCVRGDVLRFSGIDLTSKTNTSNKTAPYMTIEYTSGNSQTVDINSYESGFTVENGITTFIVYCLDGVNQSAAGSGEVARMRFSGLLTAASADDVIITKNEEIT